MGHCGVERNTTAKHKLQEQNLRVLTGLTGRGFVSMDGSFDKVIVVDLHCAERRKVQVVYLLIGKKCRYRERYMGKKYLKMKEI
jgi:hypothetical protein